MSTPYDPDRIITVLGEKIDERAAQLSLEALQSAIASIDHDDWRKQDYFYKLTEEVGELSAAIRKDVRWDENDFTTFKGSIEEEVGDVIYYAVTIANIYGIDLAKCMCEKEKLNAAKYERGIVFERNGRVFLDKDGE